MVGGNFLTHVHLLIAANVYNTNGTNTLLKIAITLKSLLKGDYSIANKVICPLLSP